jgi:hypothetical protein
VSPQSFAIAFALVLATVACNPKSLKSGYCHTTNDCKGGEKCNPDTRKCEPMMTTDASVDHVEAGVDGSDAMDARDASDVAEAPPPTCRTQPMLCADGGYDGSPGVCEAEAGVCVQCLTDGDCSTDSTKPICEAHLCRPCKADAECKIGPGVCMFHQDGHCATDDETIYVKNAAGCATAPSAGGTLAVPYCLSQDGINAVVLGRSLVVMRGPDALTEWTVATAPAAAITVIGQSGATINPGARVGVRVSAGKVYVRDLKVASGSNVGVVAETAAELTMSHCTIAANTKGGILVDAANFDITNTTVTGNGPGDDAGAAWGGLRLKNLNLPATGKKSIGFLSVMNNNQVGISCSGSVDAASVLVTGSAGGVEVSLSCNFMSCGTAVTATCGAQP